VPPEGVSGVGIDDETRCDHYGSRTDVVALRFGCCGEYYACFRCHAAIADHPPEPWPTERRSEPAARCGVCGVDLTADEYMSVDACPDCGAGFNPGCADHYHVYFEWIDGDGG
jgi:uncharacterized CHY-type Zn-finger protein